MSAHADLTAASEQRIVAAHQLHFLPWLRYVAKALAADVFVLLDDVQFVKGDWHNRNKLKGPNGWFHLTVPVHQRLGQRLDEVAIDNRRDWRRRHLESLRTSYGRAPCFGPVFRRLEEVYAAGPWLALNALNRALLDVVWELVGCRTRLLLSSDLAVEGAASRRLVDICLAVGGSHYLTGAYALGRYLDRELFTRSGLRLLAQDFESPAYAQLHAQAGHEPDLSIVDLLMVAGDATHDLLLAATGPSRAHASAEP